MTTKINLPCVDSKSGVVNYRGAWNGAHDKPMSQVVHWLMLELQRASASKTKQPPEGSPPYAGFGEIA
jgi:hypothetical protein